MTSILFEQKPQSKGPEPFVAAMYSIIPGIGQLYNGKTKKGILFLFATFISLLMLVASLHPSSTLDLALVILATAKFLFGFIFKFEFEPSPAAEFLMNSIKFGGSFSTSLILTIIAFVLYSMSDAYMDAEKALQHFDYKVIATDSTMFRFSESTASSYIIHSVAFALLFLISLFLVIPSKHEQITEIEFILPQIESKKPPPETNRRSTVQSIDQGKHNPNKPVTPAQPSRPASIPPPMPKAVQQMVIVPPKPVTPPQPKTAPKPLPKISDRPALIQAQPRPAPIQNTQTQADDSPKSAPAPESENDESASPGSRVTAVAIIPRVPGLPGVGGLGTEGNPPPNSKPLSPASIAARKDIDFGPYMNDLQRRIKRAWRPPRGNESKRVIVTFKINKIGELSDLQLKVGSGFEPSDKAAILAIQAAAPFARLPEGAPSIVDIEFTFDYNVFGSNSSYRQY